MIDLVCPQCDSDLEIDDGFRGGVCRCFNCGTLMTVPDDPDQQAPESLSRPDTPDEPSRASRSSNMSVYTTNTGRVVKLSTRQIARVPIAERKRLGIRIGVMATMGLIVVSVIAVVIYGMSVMFAPKTDVTAQQAWDYDPDTNPFLVAEPSFFGVPLDSTSVLMIDSSAAMREYLDMVKQAALMSVRTMEPSQNLQIVFWSETGPKAFPSSPAPKSKLDVQQLAEKFQSIYAEGAIRGQSAFTMGLRSNPPTVIMVASMLPPEREMQTIATQLDASGSRLIAVLLGHSSQPLEVIANDSGGKYIEISRGQIQRWYEEFLNKGGEPIVPGFNPAPDEPAEPDSETQQPEEAAQ